MKQTWEKLGEDVHTVKGEIVSLLDMLPQSAKFHKQTMRLNKAWERLKKSVSSMDAFITPVKSVEVNSPLLSNAEFAATWKVWKDYLIEQHGVFLRSRAELAGLKRMGEIAGKDPQLAVKYLEFAMYRVSANFYKVNEQEIPQTTNGEKPAPAKAGFSLDSKYNNHQKK